MRYELIDKTLFFPDKGILVVGDLHLGYDYLIQQSGVLIPERQVKDIIGELKDVFEELERKKFELKKIVFLGDIKHSFGYERKERNYFNEVLNFLKKKLGDEDVILIKGNHDTIDYSFGDKLKDYYVDGELAFIHGHKEFEEVFDKKIETILMGHLHPSVVLSEKKGVKRETYKCFLTGEFKKKNFFILPSFLSSVEGAPVNNYGEDYEDYFSIVPKKNLINFQVHVIGEDRVYSFGKIKNLN